MFRRRTTAPELIDQHSPGTAPDSNGQPDPAGQTGQAPSRSGFSPGKGRPTPKRSEAERRRRPYNAPSDRKAANKQSRDRDRAARIRKGEAMRRGENWALPRKDQGPVRALARDYVDSRRSVSEFYMFAVLALVILLFIPGLRSSTLLDYAVLVILVVVVTESVVVSRRVLRLARERFPGESTRGVRLYAAVRSSQFRRMRMPKPRVKPGDKI